MINQDITKPLIDNEDNYTNIIKLIEKSKKKCEKKHKLEYQTLKELNGYILEINDRLNSFIIYDMCNQNFRNRLSSKNSVDDLPNNDKNLSLFLKMSNNQTYSVQYLAINLDSFILLIKEKLNGQLFKLQNFESVNQKLLDEDEEINETIRMHKDSMSKSLSDLKNVLKNVEVLENIKLNLIKKGPKIQNRKFSTDEEITGITVQDQKDGDMFLEEKENNELKYMNKWMGFLTLLCFFGSLIILVLFLWENA